MRQSQLFTKTQKNAPKDEVSVNAQLLTRGGYVEKLTAGVYSFLPLGWLVLKKIENVIREEMNAISGQEISMPALQPKENCEKTSRWSTMNDLYKMKDASGREFALCPTHEEIVVPLVKKHIHSYKDIPFYAYQIQNKFRMELRAKSGLLRGREFLMKDLYSFHLDEKDLGEYYEKAKVAYWKILERVGLKEKTHLTFASGGTFSKYSHEFQTLSEAGEDIIYICEKCENAINKEIKHETPACPVCGGKKFEEKKAIEVANIFKLKDKFTKPFNLKVTDEAGNPQTLIMGCYGIGLSRLMGTIVEVYNDKDGIIWPESVAPFTVHLLSLGKNKEAGKIYNELVKNNVEVLYDDREDVNAGEKFADADLIGIPCRAVVSEKSLQAGGVEVKKRSGKESEVVKVRELTSNLKNKPRNKTSL